MTSHVLPRQNSTDLSLRSTLYNFSDISASIGLRKILTTTEEVPDQHGAPIYRAVSAAVIQNPWSGRGKASTLAPAAQRIAPFLAAILADRIIQTLGDSTHVEAFGKAALVGTRGDIEHAGALIHTPFFGNIIREALGGTSILCFVDGTAEAGAVLRVPMWHKTAAATRSHYQSIDINLPDAPHPNEIAVIAAASTGSRPYPRLGDRTTDKPVTSAILKELSL